jgi:O-antigen ligase
VPRDLPVVTSVRSTRVAPVPHGLESFLFLALMSGPPKFRGRDLSASLTGAIDTVVLIHVAVWTCGGLWVLARVYPAALRRTVVPFVNLAQILGAAFIAALTLSLWDSPGRLLTAFTLGQFAVMLTFSWVFTHRFGASACLRHLFIGATVLALVTIAAIFLAPGLVMADDTPIVLGETRLLGGNLTFTSSVALIGLVCCLSSVPPLRGPMFWGAVSLFSALLVASRTRTAYLALFVFLAIGLTQGQRLRVRKLVMPLAALAFSLFLMDAVSTTFDYVVRERQSIETMSDRLPLWEHLTTVVMREAPITGLGYYAASRIVATEYNPMLGNAHSTFFEVLVGGGLFALALYLLLCASLVWFAVRLLSVGRGQPLAVAAAGLLFVDLVIGIVSLEALHPGPLGFAFWSTTALLPGLLRETARARTAAEERPHARKSRLRLSPAPTTVSPS